MQASLHPERGKLTAEVKTFPGRECFGPWLAVKLDDGAGGHMQIILNDLDELGNLVITLGEALDGLIREGWPRAKEPTK